MNQNSYRTVVEVRLQNIFRHKIVNTNSYKDNLNELHNEHLKLNY